MRFNEEQLNELSKFETHFRTALYSNYKRGTLRKDDIRIAEIYETATGENLSKNFGCGRCNLNFYKKVAEKYFKDKEALEAVKQVRETAKAANEIVEMVADILSPAKTRKTENKGKRSPNKTNKRTSKK